MRLKDKVSIITGGQSGIGLATAYLFAKEGAKVVIADIEDANDEIIKIINQGGSAIFCKTDVSIEQQVNTLIEYTLKTYGGIDILINNAGIELAKKINITTESEWNHLIDVNLKSVFLCSKAAINFMQNNGGGTVINVASEMGIVGGTEIAAYCASKGGVVQLTKAMAIDHANDHIRVNCVCPGPVSTPLLESIIEASSNPEEERQSIVNKTLLKRFAYPEEIANVILFLASDESSYMTGSIVMVDGGWTTW
ncbi:MAG: glucose 1-dehydrogenase [Bacteroidetes bacterium]|nr:glucose 1-dehydrogenase [Bacteroidota bacterium]